MGLDFWGHGTGGGNTCKYVTGAALCANGVINVSVNWGGFGGYSIDGNVVGIIVEQSPDTKNPKVRTRVRVKTYGVVGGSTIFFETVEYTNPAGFVASSQNWSFDESRAGIIAYINVDIGSDFQYTYASGNYSDTVWVHSQFNNTLNTRLIMTKVSF